MAHRVWQIARGTTSALNSYRGPAGELILNTSTSHVVCQLGSGSIELANKTDVPSYDIATNVANGLMSSTDKAKLDGVQANATNVSIYQEVSSGNKLATVTINGNQTDIYAPIVTIKDAHLYVGAQSVAENASTSNGYTYLMFKYGDTVEKFNITGTGATRVTSDASGVITINSTDTTYTAFIGSGATAASGLVPTPPSVAGNTKFLREDGTWAEPTNTDTTYDAATALPLANGTAAVGTSVKYAREDHIHPAQTDVTGNAGTATTLATAHKLGVDLSASVDATFDGSSDQLAIPVTGTLAVNKGGTGVTTVADIQAGKDSAGNSIVATYATKAELSQLKLNSFVKVNSLPATGEEGVVYLTPVNGSVTEYTAYVWEDNAYIVFGPATLDLSQYALKSDAIKAITVSGTTLTITKADNTTQTLTTQDTTYVDATTSTSGLMSATDKTKLDGLSNYTLPEASSSTLGGVKVGSNLSISNGVLSANFSTATSSANGLMSSTDKSKLDGVQANATKVSVTQTLTSGTEIASISVNDTPVTLYAPTSSSGGSGATYSDYVTVTGTNIDLSQGDVFYKVLSANTTFTFSNLPTGSGVRKITIILKNGDNFTVTWPNSVKWVRGAAPSIYTNVYMVEFTILGTDIVS